MVNDNGFVFNAEEPIRITEKKLRHIFSAIAKDGIESILRENIRNTELMKRKFRHVAARSFMVLRNYKGYRIPVRRQQFNSQLLLKASEEIDPDFPVIKETYREILNDTMDMRRAAKIADMLSKGEMKCKLIKTPVPSPFSHSMVTFGQADAILMKDRHMHLQRLHRLVIARLKAGK
jgi:ATP-dependent Lhr-like helicase